MLPDLPRTRLVWPTPLHRLESLERALGNAPRIWLKRDDLTPLGLGGNKLRKLEYLLGDALERGAKTVVTTGAEQSNHAFLTACAARRAGLHPVLLLRADAHAEPRGNLLLDRLIDAELRFDPEPRANWVEEVCEEIGPTAYAIPYGGSNVLGALGYVRAAHELGEQLEAQQVTPVEIVHASSSGGTQAGLIAGRAAGDFDARVAGVSVDEDEATLSARVAELAGAVCSRLELDAPGAVEVDDRHIGPGYALLDTATREAVRSLLRTEGVLLDPVYTGKAFRGLLVRIAEGRYPSDSDVVFWHTGGRPAVFKYGPELL